MSATTSLKRRRWLIAAGVATALSVAVSPAIAGGTPTAATATASLPPLPAGTAPGSLQGVAQITGARAAWSVGARGQGVDVALIDTGVAPVPGLDAPGKVVNGVDLSFDSQQAGLGFADAYGHGTHLASIIAGSDSSVVNPLLPGDGFVGIAPAARIVNVRAGDALGRVDVTQVIAALDWVVANQHANGLNIRVICLAYGTDTTQSYRTDPLAHAVENAWRHGIVVVTSAGNSGFTVGKPAPGTTSPGLTMPAADPMVIAVGGADPNGTLTTADDTAAGFTSGGADKRNPDLLAPAVSLEGLRVPGSTVDELYGATAGEGRFIRGSGTSQAAAVVAGLVADLLSVRPTLTPDQVKALLGATADKLPKVDQAVQGFGEVDIVRAGLTATPSTKAPAPSPGGGSIEASRGTSHLVIDGAALTGERDWFGQPLSGSALATAENAGTAWSGDAWLGRLLSDGPWALASWTGSDWTSRSWTDEGWDSRSWTDAGWTSRSWTGAAWLDSSWTSRSW